MKTTTTNFTIPKKLKQHKISFFSATKFFANAENTHKTVACYIHNTYPLDMHKHDFFEINIITKGFGVHYINNKKIDVHPGMVFILSPETSHGYINLGELEIFHVILPYFFFDKFYDELSIANNFSELFPKNICSSFRGG